MRKMGGAEPEDRELLPMSGGRRLASVPDMTYELLVAEREAELLRRATKPRVQPCRKRRSRSVPRRVTQAWSTMIREIRGMSVKREHTKI